MEKQITKHLGHKRYSPATLSELLRQLNLTSEDETSLQRSLREMERSGLVVRLKGGRYLSSQSTSLVTGRIQITKGGRGFLTPDDPARSEIAIPSAATATALNEDRVIVLCEPVTKSFWKKADTDEAGQSGTVVSILERRRTRFVGTFQQSSKGLLVTPDDPRFTREIRVMPPQKRIGYAKAGDKVVVELLRWDSRHATPEGRVVEILGAVEKTGVDMLGVLRQYDLTGDFPEAVLKEARRRP
jgi:ribonuclease R